MIGWEPAVPARQKRGLPRLVRRRKHRSPFVEYPALIFTALVVALLTKAFLAQAFYIPSPSMYPELKNGDRVVVSKLSYRLHDVNRGDIVVFRAPDSPPEGGSLVTRWLHDALEAVGLRRPPDDELIKRVIGLPGETVEGKAGHVYVNGRLLVEPYLDESVSTSDFGPVSIPDGHLWVMGDNRENSADSRVFGAIEESTIAGRALFRLWPPWRIAFL